MDEPTLEIPDLPDLSAAIDTLRLTAPVFSDEQSVAFDYVMSRIASGCGAEMVASLNTYSRFGTKDSVWPEVYKKTLTNLEDPSVTLARTNFHDALQAIPQQYAFRVQKSILEQLETPPGWVELARFMRRAESEIPYDIIHTIQSMPLKKKSGEPVDRDTILQYVGWLNYKMHICEQELPNLIIPDSMAHGEEEMARNPVERRRA